MFTILKVSTICTSLHIDPMFTNLVEDVKQPLKIALNGKTWYDKKKEVS